MQRFSVSLNDDLAAWIESQAENRGVSKAKVIRDAIEAARDKKAERREPEKVIERIDELEHRVQQLERDCDLVSDQTDGESVNSDQNSESDIINEYHDFLANHPPQTDHGKAAVITTLQILRDQGPLSTQELRQTVYEQHSENYSDSRSMWNSIQRYFSDLPGIEKSGYGEWEYAGDEVVRTKLAFDSDE